MHASGDERDAHHEEHESRERLHRRRQNQKQLLEGPHVSTPPLSEKSNIQTSATEQITI